MTMQRRPIGRGRTLAAVGAVVAIVGCILPWWTVGGGTEGLPPQSGNAFDASGILVFLASIVTIALVTLPYAAGDRPLGIDRWPVYLVIVIVGWLGLVLRIVDLMLQGAFRFSDPSQAITNGPGLWVAGIGLAILSRATFDMARERGER